MEMDLTRTLVSAAISGLCPVLSDFDFSGAVPYLPSKGRFTLGTATLLVKVLLWATLADTLLAILADIFVDILPDILLEGAILKEVDTVLICVLGSIFGGGCEGAFALFAALASSLLSVENSHAHCDTMAKAAIRRRMTPRKGANEEEEVLRASAVARCIRTEEEEVKERELGRLLALH